MRRVSLVFLIKRDLGSRLEDVLSGLCIKHGIHLGFGWKHDFLKGLVSGFGAFLMVRSNRESKTHGMVLDPSLGLDLLATLGLEIVVSCFACVGILVRLDGVTA